MPVALSPRMMVRFLRTSNSYFKRFVETIILYFPFMIVSPVVDSGSWCMSTVTHCLFHLNKFTRYQDQFIHRIDDLVGIENPNCEWFFAKIHEM